MIAYIGIGSNLGNRKKNLTQAIGLLKRDKNISLIKKSRFYETEPLGGLPQGKFLNGALKIQTDYSPEELLWELKKIESILGRKKTNLRWGPRTLDLDILFYGDCIMKNSYLTLPHPEIAKRTFVLKPLAQIAPNFRHPVLKKTIKQLWQEIASGKDETNSPY